MADQELKKMSRAELLELLLESRQENAELQQELYQTKQRLNSK